MSTNDDQRVAIERTLEHLVTELKQQRLVTQGLSLRLTLLERRGMEILEEVQRQLFVQSVSMVHALGHVSEADLMASAALVKTMSTWYTPEKGHV